MATHLPQPGIYRHYKGNLYEVIGFARHSETMEELVLYKALRQPEGSNLWVRPLQMFTESIFADGKEIPRFELISRNDPNELPSKKK